MSSCNGLPLDFTPYSRPLKDIIGIGQRIRKHSFYKYVPLDTALKMLENNTVRFQVPTTWNDPFEKLYYTADYSDVMLNYFDTKLFAYCVTGQSSCEAAWKMYTDNEYTNPCVLFKIYAGQFRRFIQDYIVKDSIGGKLYEGAVRYGLTDSKIRSIGKVCNTLYEYYFADFSLVKYLNLMLLKRAFYNYEQEIRFMYQPTSIITEDYIDITIPWSHCLYSIQLPPRGNIDSIKKQLQDAVTENKKLCDDKFSIYHHSIIPIIENPLYMDIQSIKIESSPCN